MYVSPLLWIIQFSCKLANSAERATWNSLKWDGKLVGT